MGILSTDVGNLRGSRRTRRVVAAQPPTLANKVKRLEIQVAKQKPELQSQRTEYGATIGSAGVSTATTDVGGDFVAAADFRDMVTGDKWANKFMLLNLNDITRGATAKYRVCVYVAKRPSLVFVPATNHEFDAIPDSSNFHVLYDEVLTPANNQHISIKEKINMNNMVSIYDHDNSVFAKGQIRIFHARYVTAGQTYRFSTGVYFTNK